MASTAPPETRHRIPVRILVVAASIFAFLGILTTWIDRQALDTNEWVGTSGKLLEDKAISDALAVYAVDQLYANVDVSATLHKRLPHDLQPIAAPAAAGIRGIATTAAEQALQSPRVQTVWKQTNRVAHTNLVQILEGKSSTVSSSQGKVVLNLRPVVLQLADRVGLKKQVNDRLPADVGQLEVADSKQLDTAKTVTQLLEGLAWLFSIGSLVLFVGAAYLAKGRRWVVVLGYGIGLVAAGLAAIAVRSVAGNFIVDQLATAEEARVPAEHAWNIATSLLQSISTSVIAVGVLFTVAAFLDSPARGAITIREALAPTLRERPAIVWSIFAAVSLLVLIIWPPGGTRQLVVILSVIALAAAGLVALRRRTAVEFPGVNRGDWMRDMRARARRASAETGRRIGSAMRELTDDDRHPDDARLDRLERLGELKEKGVLTAAEFREQKKKILADLAVNGGQSSKAPSAKSGGLTPSTKS